MKKLVAIGLVVFVAQVAVAEESVRFIPAAASAPGANATFWVSDARVFNPDPDATISVALSLLVPGVDNSGAGEVEVTVPPRQAVALDDLVQSVFGVEGGGAIRLRSDARFLASSRTYNIGDGESGTFGQFIPALETVAAMQQGILLSIVNDPADDGFRSNLGFVNSTVSEVEVSFDLYDGSSGQRVGSGELSLPPLAPVQLNNVFASVGEGDLAVDNATIEFTASAPVFAYASVVDNTSGDAIFVQPEADEGTPDPVNRPPDGAIEEPAGDLVITAGDVVDFRASASDPDGDAITGMEWDFGDAISASGLEVAHTYSDPGTFVASFTPIDENGLADPTPATRTITVEPAATAATFTDVQTRIFTPSCAFAGCHGGGSARAGLDLSAGSAYANLVGVASTEQPSLNRVEPSHSAQSYLYLKVTGDPSITGATMPLGAAPLTDEVIEVLRSWIDAGAADD